MRTQHVQHKDTRGRRSVTMPDINRAEIARKLSMSRGQISKILSGKSGATYATMVELAKLFSITVEDLDKRIKDSHR